MWIMSESSMSFVILTHGGAGSPAAYRDGCERACLEARRALEGGRDAFAAAIAATEILEDDSRFNAGTGANIRLDGRTIEMDAAVVSDDGRYGAVGCIQRVRHPIAVAARVTETRHLLLVGTGATAFARKLGFEDYNPETPEARARFSAEEAQRRSLPAHEAESAAQLDRFYNFGDGRDCDTVGAVVRDSQGRFAATASTGGTSYNLLGRVGDSPLLGCGLYAGEHGAIACTGVGEEITRRLLAKTAYDNLAHGWTAEQVAKHACSLFPQEITVGILVVGKTSYASLSNRDMATAVLAKR